MLFILIKNNLKLMFRDKLSILFLVAMPVILIAVLSSAFKKQLNTSYKMEPFTIGYSVEVGSTIEESIPRFIKEFEENGINLTKMPKEEAQEKIKENQLAAFLEISDSKYTIHKKEGFNVDALIFENSMGTAMYYYDGTRTLMKYIKKTGSYDKVINEGFSENRSYVKVENLEVDPMPSSTVYYGIVQIVYIIWIGIISVSMIVNNERKYGLDKRIGLSKVSSLTLFVGKLIPAVLAVAVETGIAAVVSTILMDINWGSSPLFSAGILLLEVIAVAALGITASLFIRNQALSNVIIFISGFFFGFVGGSFQTYMLNFVSDKLAKISPLYYINRTLVEFSTKGYSDYVSSCIVFLLAIALISTMLGVVITAKGRRAA